MFKRHSDIYGRYKSLLAKSIALLIGLMLFLNCFTFSCGAYVDLNETFNVQKDVFEAVLFVSETIEKISVSVSGIIVSNSVPGAASKAEQNETKDVFPVKEAVLSSPSQYSKHLKNLNLINIFNRTSAEEKFILKVKHLLTANAEGRTLFYFLIMMIYFILMKKPDDKIGAITYIYGKTEIKPALA